MNEKRETLFEDRTHCHADHVVQGMDRGTTAAVGVLKAVKFEEEKDMFESRYASGNSGLISCFLGAIKLSVAKFPRHCTHHIRILFICLG